MGMAGLEEDHQWFGWKHAPRWRSCNATLSHLLKRSMPTLRFRKHMG